MFKNRFGFLSQDILTLLSSRKPRFFYLLAIFLYAASFLLRISVEYIKVFNYRGFLSLSSEYTHLFIETFDAIENLLAIIAFGSILYGIFLQVSKQIKIESNRDIFINVGQGTNTGVGQEQNEETLLRSYYGQVLQQSNLSFTFSLIFAAAGFLFIVYTFNTAVPPDELASRVADETAALESLDNNWPSIVAFGIIEAVSALFFVQTNNARKTMIEFADKLRLDNKLEESLSLIETIEDKIIQSQVKALLVLNFSGIPMKYDDQDILKKIIVGKHEDMASS